MRSEVARSGVI